MSRCTRITFLWDVIFSLDMLYRVYANLLIEFSFFINLQQSTSKSNHSCFSILLNIVSYNSVEILQILLIVDFFFVVLHRSFASELLKHFSCKKLVQHGKADNEAATRANLFNEHNVTPLE